MLPMVDKERCSLGFSVAFFGGVIGIVGLAASVYESQRRKREVSRLNSTISRQDHELSRQAQDIAGLEKLAASEARQRVEERKGRTEAERRLRAEKQALEEANGYKFDAVGTISTPFRDRRGTPRQGSITPLSKGKVLLDSSMVGYPALIGLLDFSHVWLLFVFHDNTNAIVNGASDDRRSSVTTGGATRDASSESIESCSAIGGPDSRGEGAEESRQSGHEAKEPPLSDHAVRRTFLTKVIPPRLGKKVGVLGTRSPHRPNPVGLTMVKLEGVDLKTNSFTVSGVDLVDGTPIIDVKPVIPHDVPQQMRVPEWVKDDLCLRRVVFMDEANQGLEAYFAETGHKRKNKFYADMESIKAAVVEVLVQDVRSVHQGRGLASNELYECFFDGVVFHFITTVEEIHVVSVT